jgi:outer membrane receptor protein involved in Fe transport
MRSRLLLGTGALLLATSSAAAQPAPAEPKAPPPAAPVAKAAEPKAQPADPKAPRVEPAAPAPLEVVVSATRNPRDPFNLPVGTTVVTRKQIERRPAAATNDQLRDQPGIWSGESFYYSTPMLRGITGNQTVLMIDGVRMNTAIAFAGDNTWSQAIDIESVDRIEVVRGPGSVMWGTDAVGGVIHYLTRPPPDWPEEGVRFAGRLSATLGSNDALQRYRGEAGAATPWIRVRLGVTSLSVGDLTTAGPMGVLSPSGWKSRALDGRIDLRLPHDDVLSLTLQDVRNTDAQAYELSFNRPTVWDATRQLALLRYEMRRLGSAVERLEAWVGVHHQHGNTHQLADGKDFTTDVWTLTGDVQAHSRPSPNLELTYGLHAHGDIAHSVNANGPVQTRAFPDSSWVNGGAFVLADASFTKYLSVMPGVRADFFRLKSSPDAASVPAGMSIGELRVDNLLAAPTGSLGLVGHVTPWLNLVASGSRGFRAPNVSDQLSSGPFRTGYSIPSPGLHPESSWNLEAGFRVNVPKRVRAEATFWHTWFRDLITSTPRNPDLSSNDCVDINGNGVCDVNEHVYKKTNVGRAHNLGVEGAVTVFLPYWLSVYAVGTWMTARTDDTDQPVNFLPPANGTIGVRFEPKRFYVEPYVRLVAPVSAKDIPCSRLLSDGAYHADPRNPSTSPLLGTLQVSADGLSCSGSFPGHVTLGLRAGAMVASFLDVHISLNNITNAAYRDEYVRYDGGGFGAFGTVTVHEPRELP